MSLNNDIILTGFLEDALDSEHGIKLVLESADEMLRMRRKLYNIRKMDERYQTLTLSEHKHELWIVKNETKT